MSGYTAHPPTIGGSVEGSEITDGTITGADLSSSINIATTGYISLGSGTPAGAGLIRTAHAQSLLQSKDSGGTDRELLSWGVSGTDELRIGETVSRYNLLFSATSATMFDGASPRFTFSASVFESAAAPLIQFDNGLTGCGFIQENTAAASTAGAALRVRAQGATGTGDNAGGALQLSGGRRSNAGLKGGLALELNTDDSTFERLAEIVELAAGRRALALLDGGTGVTTTDMPANTGDNVIWIGNAATAPTANPANGGIVYATGGALLYRGSGGTITTLGPA